MYNLYRVEWVIYSDTVDPDVEMFYFKKCSKNQNHNTNVFHAHLFKTLSNKCIIYYRLTSEKSQDNSYNF